MKKAAISAPNSSISPVLQASNEAFSSFFSSLIDLARF
jgi:hypothetical protein